MPVSDLHATLPPLDEPGDAELISAVRDGDLDAYGTLFARHVDSARRLARQLVSAGDVDDLVSEAFAKVLSVLQRGGGPDLAFRAYLLTALRRLHVDKLRAGARLTTTDDMTAFDPGVPFEDTAVSGFDNAAAAKAFASLPERWQQVLWHTEVEGQKPADIAPLLGMSPNSVSALAYRAREGLRQAFVTMHAQEAADDVCAATRANLGAYLRGGISKRDAAKVEAHLQGCRECSGIYLELAEVNNDLGAVLAPMLLGSAGIGYLAAAHAGVLGAKAGVLLLLGRGRDWLLHNPAGRAVAAGGGVVAAGVVAAGLALGLHGHSAPPAAAPRPTPAPSSPAPTPSTPPTSPAPKTHHPAPPKVTPPATVVPVVAPAPSPPAPPADPVIHHPLAPVALTSAGQPVTIDLTKGASDPNGDPLRVVSATVAKPAHGTVVIDRAPGRETLSALFARQGGRPTSITYTPQPGWRGTDTIEYVLADQHGGTVAGKVRVTTPNAAPVAAADTVTAASAWGAGTATRIDVLANDTDPNGDTLTVTAVTQPSHGTAALADGVVSYTPVAGYAGPDSFGYTISDGHGGTATGTVTITVGALPDRAPVAHDDEATADAAWSSPAPVMVDVLANDTDPDGDALSLASVGDAAHGTVAIEADRLVYTPDAGFSGEDIVTYVVSDGRGLTDSGTVTITVGPLPDRAPVAHDASVATAYETTLPIDLGDHASDPDADPLTFTAGEEPSHGVVLVSPDGHAIYTPDAGFDGTDSFGYTVADGHGETATATVTVTVAQPSSDLAITSSPATVSGYEHVNVAATGIPPGRTATVHIHVSGITGWELGGTHALGAAVKPDSCALPATPSGDLSLTCTLTGNGGIMHLDFTFSAGWSVDVSVSPDDFTDPDSGNNTFHRDGSVQLGS
jgi:RNA polymerase sigma factor (sigma-70 family)